ncbi:hypothetical protein MKX03_017719, partial [Papaver bracteatum]
MERLDDMWNGDRMQDLSANIGVLLCLKCCGLINLDDWSDEEVVSIIKIGGNSSANSTHNACIPDGITKPGADSSLERSSKFV